MSTQPGTGLSIDTDETGAIVTAEGLALEPHEQDHLHDAIRAALLQIAAARETAPHPVHLEPTFREETSETWDPDHPAAGHGEGPWSFTEWLPAMGAETCPDCRRPLQAGNSSSVAFDFLACPAVPAGPLQPEDRPCHPGCLVACGVTRG